MTIISELTTTVNILQGSLRGGKATTDNGIEYFEFLDIPYAKPPIEELRFKKPEPPQPWIGVRDASKVNLNHLSCQYFYGTIRGSEDCLYLCVYVPKRSSTENKLLPVMVYIHGGGFLDGNGINKNDLGHDYFIEKNVVVVSINFRLGILGFLCLDIPEAAGNMGLKDQIQALRWVRDNIEEFGGDINNVTLFGTGSGAALIDYLLLAPAAHGLFHKAILQSGSSLSHWTFSNGMEKILKELLIDLDYSGSLNDNYAIYNYLRNLSAAILTKNTKKIMREFYDKKVAPTIEKDFGDGSAIITDTPYQLFKEGKYNRVPLIKGFCDKEGYMIFNRKENKIKKLLETKKNFVTWPYKIAEEDEIKYSSAIYDAYLENVKSTDDDDKCVIQYIGDFNVVGGVWLQGNILSNDNVPVYMNPTPNNDFSIQWPKFTPDSPVYLNINTTLTIKSNYEPKKMAIFKKIYDKYKK